MNSDTYTSAVRFAYMAERKAKQSRTRRTAQCLREGLPFSADNDLRNKATIAATAFRRIAGMAQDLRMDNASAPYAMDAETWEALL